MTIAILWVVCVGNEVPTSDIIDVAIAIIVDAIISNLAWIDPDIALEVWMVEIDSRVDNRHSVVRIASVNVPRLRSIDVIQLAGGVVHSPGASEEWVIRNNLCRNNVVQAGAQNGRLCLKGCHRSNRITICNMDERKAIHDLILIDRTKANFSAAAIFVVIGCIHAELHQQGIRIVLSTASQNLVAVVAHILLLRPGIRRNSLGMSGRY